MNLLDGCQIDVFSHGISHDSQKFSSRNLWHGTFGWKSIGCWNPFVVPILGPVIQGDTHIYIYMDWKATSCWVCFYMSHHTSTQLGIPSSGIPHTWEIYPKPRVHSENPRGLKFAKTGFGSAGSPTGSEGHVNAEQSMYVYNIHIVYILYIIIQPIFYI